MVLGLHYICLHLSHILVLRFLDFECYNLHRTAINSNKNLSIFCISILFITLRLAPQLYRLSHTAYSSEFSVDKNKNEYS